jgi:hypothetical protein
MRVQRCKLAVYAEYEALVDVTGLEPATPCLQRTEGKTLTALCGVAYTENQRNFRSLKYPEVVPNRSGRVVEGGALEKLNRRFAIWLKIQLNPFASRKIATISVFWICSIFARFAPVLVTIW